MATNMQQETTNTNTNAGSEENQDKNEKCAYYVQKRGRHCRMRRVRGSHYCAEHLLHETSSMVEVTN